MSDKPDRDGTEPSGSRGDALAAADKAEQERLRERLQQVEINVGRIDAQHGHGFRDRIREVRRKLDEAERGLERSAGHGSRDDTWSTLSAEIDELEARLRS